jgi:hypothetical protein
MFAPCDGICEIHGSELPCYFLPATTIDECRLQERHQRELPLSVLEA